MHIFKYHENFLLKFKLKGIEKSAFMITIGHKDNNINFPKKYIYN